MSDDWLEAYRDQAVVIDLQDHYMLYGTLVAFGPDHLELADTDLHDHSEANSSKEVYSIESKRLGVRANRRRVGIPRHKLMAISRLDDVLS